MRELELEYAVNNICRLQDNTTQSIESSTLHLDLIGELKRINSHICSIAYPILDSAGVLAANAFANAAIIAAYTVVDGQGVRTEVAAGDSALRCVMILFVLDGLPYPLRVWLRRSPAQRRQIVRYARGH